MKETIYFAGSIRGGRDDRDVYARIIGLLSRYGEVSTEHVADAKISSYGESDLSDAQIFSRDCDWLAAATVVVAEVTTPSLGVGYELGRAESEGKRILCLWRPSDTRRLSAMVTGNPAVTVYEYQDIAELEKLFDEFFLKAA